MIIWQAGRSWIPWLWAAFRIQRWWSWKKCTHVRVRPETEGFFGPDFCGMRRRLNHCGLFLTKGMLFCFSTNSPTITRAFIAAEQRTHIHPFCKRFLAPITRHLSLLAFYFFHMTKCLASHAITEAHIYQVTNLGACGSTMLKKGNSPYWQRPQFTALSAVTKVLPPTN
jgi:hypothetical protein